MNKIDTLYKDYADLYSILSHDRDFNLQVSYMLNICKSNIKKSLELFSGPSVHSVALFRSGIDAYAIDSSHRMKEIALNNGLPKNNFIIGEIPEVLDDLKDIYDLIYIPRYSVGYLNKKKLYKLIKELFRLAGTKGNIIIELHKLDILTSKINNLGIKSRTFNYNEKKYKCIWPNGNVVWNDRAWRCSMKVSLSTANWSKDFNSEEYIHTIEDIEFLVDLIDSSATVSLINNSEAFIDTNLIHIKR